MHMSQQWNPSAIASCAPAAVGEFSHRPQGANGALDLAIMRHHRECSVHFWVPQDKADTAAIQQRDVEMIRRMEHIIIKKQISEKKAKRSYYCCL